MRISAALAAAILIAGCGTVKEASQPRDTSRGEGPDCHQGDEMTCKIEKRITELVNEKRAQSGRAELAHHKELGYVSRDWSQKQGARGSIGHDGFPQERNEVYEEEFGDLGELFIAGENVAMFGGGDDDDDLVEGVASRFVTMWWNSAGHRANMLANHEVHGAGVVKNTRGHWYATQLFGKE